MPAHFLGEGPIPEAPQIQPGSVPRRLYEAFHQLLLALTAQSPTVLVLEDLQWADETTLSVLDFLIRRWDHGSLQFLLSVRSEEVRSQSFLDRFLEGVRLHGEFLEVSLEDLDATESEALIRQLSPDPLETTDVSHLRSLAGGNPFFLIELTLEFLAGRLDPGVKPQEILAIPLSIRQVLRRRLSQLSEEAERALDTLAVFGKPLDIPGVARIGRLPGSKCLAGLDQLDQFRLVARRGSLVRIPHELIRQTVYQDLGESQRLWLHERVGRFLVRSKENPPPDELAVHFHRADAKAEAKHYSTEAADRAEASGAVAEALRFLRIAREYSEETEEVTDLIGRMGHLNYLHQSLEEAAPLLELAAQRFRREGRREKALEVQVEQIDSLAQSAALPPSECLEELSRLKKEATDLACWDTYTGALDVEVHLFDNCADLASVRRALGEAAEVADRGGSKARCQARAILALNVYFGSPSLGLVAAREAVRISLETEDTDLQLHALNRLIVVLLYQGRLHLQEGLNAFAMAEPRLQRSGDLILRFFIRLNRAVWHLEVGELAAARNAFASVEPVIRGREARNAHARLLLNQGELALAELDFDSAQDLFRRAESFLGPASPESFRWIIDAGQGLTDLHFGRLGEARKREAELSPFPKHWTFDPSVVAAFKANMLRMRGAVEEAEHLLGEIAEDVEDRFVTAWIKLTLERARLLSRRTPGKAREIAEKAIRLTSHLSLRERSEQLRRVVNA
jgi:predicted ATPase